MPWYGYALLAAVGISFVSLLQKRTLRQEHSLEYAMIFSTMKVLIFLPLFWNQIVWAVTARQAVLLTIGGMFGATAFLLIVKAIRRLELSTVTPVLAIEPGLVALLAVPTLRETISVVALTGLALMLIGTYILELQQVPPGWWQQLAGSRMRIFYPFTVVLRRPGGWFALLGLAAFTASALISRRILLEVPVPTFLAYDFTVVAAIYLVIFFAQRRRIQILRPGQEHLLFIILLIAVIHIAQSGAQAVAMGLAPIGLVIAVKRLSVLIDVTVGGRLFHEHRLLQKLTAAMIMVTGTYLIVAA